jgi:hypothetical protein
MAEEENDADCEDFQEMLTDLFEENEDLQTKFRQAVAALRYEHETALHVIAICKEKPRCNCTSSHCHGCLQCMTRVLTHIPLSAAYLFAGHRRRNDRRPCPGRLHHQRPLK